ncbi:MAG: hypothetical protein K6F75_00135 [Butyrivibrio sp.]|nr:hypothetical protein [Butyrivibrio sp.]
MNFIPLVVPLDEACIGDFLRRYHFDEKDKKDILRLYRQVEPRVHAEFHYVLTDSDRALPDEAKEDATGAKKAIVVVTLGQAFDELQESFLKKGDIHKAYILDCIGLEVLWAAYDEIDKKLFELTGLYAGDYTFVGDCDLPITEVPRLMGLLGQKQVTYNEAYVLIPKKSVVFEAPLLREKKEKYARCAACSNDKCSMRQTA